MKPLKVASILMVPVAGALVGYGAAAAQGNSDAAQGCLQGPQNVYYSGPTTDGASDAFFKKYFPNHGQCTSFFATHKSFVFDKAYPSNNS